jgi:predicted SAM-dependent methyltransferase
VSGKWLEARPPALLNIGCGSVWHPDWINLDVHPVSPEVRAWDADHGLPFEDGSIDGCYASHLLEHLSREGAQRLLLECLRVLRSGGVLRLAVPDLEAIAREYLRVLSQAQKGDPAAVKQYEWITLELLDQLVRAESGGEMGRYLRNQASQNADYVTLRIGSEATPYVRNNSQNQGGSTEPHHAPWNNSHGQRLQQAFTALQERFVTGVSSLLLGQRGRSAVQEGFFRTSGECHRWMYDQFSLTQLLIQCGFSDMRRRTAFESQILTFDVHNLDVVNGEIRKPDSLFMEAVRP